MKAAAPAKGGVAATAEAAKSGGEGYTQSRCHDGIVVEWGRKLKAVERPQKTMACPIVLRGHTYKWEFASERWHVISIVELQKSELQNSFDSIA